MENANTISTPLDLNIKLEPQTSNGALTQNGHYMLLMGSLMYAAIET